MTKDGGVLLGKGGYHGNVFRIKRPMCITKEDAYLTVQVLEGCSEDNEGNRNLKNINIGYTN